MEGPNTQRTAQDQYNGGQSRTAGQPQYNSSQPKSAAQPQYNSGQPRTAAPARKITAQDCLLHILKNASWVSGEYKEQAHEDESLDFLRELYLCSQEDVPIDRITEARKTAAPAQTLRAYRNRCMEDRILSRQIKRLDDQVDRIDALETNVDRMQEIISNIKEIQANMQGVMGEVQMPRKEKLEDSVPEELPEDADGTTQADISEMLRRMEEMQKQINKNQDAKPENGLRHFFARLFSSEQKEDDLEEKPPEGNPPVSRGQKRNVADWVSRLMKKEGYNVAQADWITDCLQAGDTPEELMKFIRPNLSVEMMKKLRSYYYPDRPPARNSSLDIPGFAGSERAENASIRRTGNTKTGTAEGGAGNYGRR